MGRSRTATDRRPLTAPLGLGLLGAAAVTAVALRDPHVAGSWGVCPVLRYTGFYCPGCGGLRAVHDLAHLHPIEALSSNLMVVGFMAVVGIGWLAWVGSAATGRRVDLDRYLTPRRVYLGLALLAAFTVLRNTAIGSWLAP